MSRLGAEWTDSAVWEYAQLHDMVIVSKDADFSDRMMVSEPPPRAIHLRTGNMRLAQMRELLVKNWQNIEALSKGAKLLIVSNDLIECIE